MRVNYSFVCVFVVVAVMLFDGAQVYGQRHMQTRVLNASHPESETGYPWEQQVYLQSQGWLALRVFNDNGVWENIIGDGGRLARSVPPPRQYQPPRNNNTIQAGYSSQSFRLTPGDVILNINGEWIGGQEDVTSAIARSPQTMYLTVRDGRTGRVADYVTLLDSSRPRFGVNHQTNPGGGSRVTGVNKNSPATRCYLVE